MNASLTGLLVLVAMTAPAIAAEPPTGQPAKIELIQTIRDGDGGAPLNSYIQSVTAKGDYVYVALRHTGKLLYFKRDQKVGTLTYSGVIGGDYKQIYKLVSLGGRFYGVCGGPSHSLNGKDALNQGLRWFDIDPKTGAPTEKGKIEIPLASEWDGILASRDEKYLYVLARAQGKVVRFQPDAQGTPVKVDELVFKDIAKDSGCWRLSMTADGKAMYALSAEGENGQDMFLNGARVKDDGSLAYTGHYSLKEINEGITWPKNKWGYGVGRGCGISPNGLFCYADFFNFGSPEPRLVLYSRDPKTNAIAFKENLTGPNVPKMTAACDGPGYSFEPDGTTGYCLGHGGLNWFTCNPKTGQLTYGATVPLRGNPMCMYHDSENGFIYVTTWDFNSVYVVKTGKKTAP